MTAHNPGSHKLTADQTIELQTKYGASYRHVETAPYGIGMNRATRRRLKKQSKRP